MKRRLDWRGYCTFEGLVVAPVRENIVLDVLVDAFLHRVEEVKVVYLLVGQFVDGFAGAGFFETHGTKGRELAALFFVVRMLHLKLNQINFNRD
jgi:hypothetical protein